MAKQPRGLGRGYDALISTTVPGTAAAARQTPDAPDTAPPPANVVREIPVERIEPSPWQPRENFDEEALRALAQSIREQGLLQPLGVRRIAASAGKGQDGERYELVMGERRFRALKLLGRAKAPVIVMDVADARVREAALVENLQRADLNPLEIANAYQALVEENGYTQEVLAERVGVSRAQVTNILRLLGLPDEVRRSVAEGALSASQARTLLALPDAASQLRLARRTVEEGLSVRQLEELVKRPAAGSRNPSRAANGPKAAAAAAATPAAVAARDLAERLQRHFATRVAVEDKNGAGRIVLEYAGPDEAARILRLMGLDVE